MENFKMDESIKERPLGLKDSNSEESELDEEQVPFITNNFLKFFKQGKIMTEMDQVAGAGPMKD